MSHLDPHPRPEDVAFTDAVLYELRWARQKFPVAKHRIPALVEEVGELSAALLECSQSTDPDKNTLAHLAHRVYEEAVQVAAMAARIAVEGDTAFPEYAPIHIPEHR